MFEVGPISELGKHGKVRRPVGGRERTECLLARRGAAQSVCTSYAISPFAAWSEE